MADTADTARVPRPRRPRPVAPWTRTRLRTAPGAACALAVLVLLTAWSAAAFPRALDTFEDAGLRRATAAADPFASTLLVTAPPPYRSGSTAAAAALGAREQRRSYAAVVGALPRPLTADPDQSSYGVQTSSPLPADDPWLPRPSGLPPRLALAAQNDLGAHARVTAGRLPRATAPATATTRAVEAAVTTTTARRLGIRPGAVVHVPRQGRQEDTGAGRLAVTVTGIVRPRAVEGAYWGAQPILHAPVLTPVDAKDPDAPTYWLGALLLPPDAAPALLGTPGAPVRLWRVAPGTGALTAHDAPRLGRAIASVTGGPALARIRRSTGAETRAATGLDDVLTSFAALRSGIAPVVAVAAFGAATAGGVVLMMAGGLAARRRRAEFALLRSRGVSLPGLAGRLAAETAVVAVPAGALGCTAALLTLEHGRLPSAVAAAALVTVVACAALPLRAVVAHRRVRLPGARDDLVTARPSRRRTVVELTLLVLAVAAVAALRVRGAADGDDLVALAPALTAVVAALLLARFQPLPLRALARPARRLRGAVAPLALARAGRAPAGAAVLPLVALLTALTTAAFGGCVLAGIEQARDSAALRATGADARVDALAPLPAALPSRLRGLPGVRDVAPVSIAYRAASADDELDAPTTALIGVAPGGYARLAERVGLGAFPARALEAPAGAGTTGADAGAGTADSGAARSGAGDGAGDAGAAGAGDAGAVGAGDAGAVGAGDAGAVGAGNGGGRVPLPAMASPDVAHRYGTRPVTLSVDGFDVPVHIVLVRSATPAVPDGGDFLVVDSAGLGALGRPTSLLLTGDGVDPAALTAAAGPATGVKVRAQERAGYAASPLQRGAEHIYLAAVAAGAGYAVLALLLAAARAAPERSALLARLRTMGLTRRQGRRLLMLEALPGAVLASAGGALTAWACVLLLAPGFDLSAIALAGSASGGSGSIAFGPDAVSLLVPAAVLLVPALGLAGVQAWWSGRRGSVAELRVGDPG